MWLVLLVRLAGSFAVAAVIGARLGALVAAIAFVAAFYLLSVTPPH